MKKIIIVDGLEIEFTRKNIKNINIRLYHKSKKIKVSAPLNLSENLTREFIRSKKEWILNKFEEKKMIKSTDKYSYVDGEEHFFRGKKYILRIIITKNLSKITLTDFEIQMAIPNNNCQKCRENFLDDWYRSQLQEKGRELITKWEKIIGVKVNEFRIKKMKTRWGTCNFRVKRIWLSLELMKKSDECLEYVVVHELVHLLEPSHNKRFKMLMTKFLPNWKALQRQLKK